MRLTPRHWSTETWWCSMKGHVAPAAQAQYPGCELAQPLPDGTQLARCLRCDAWVHTTTPNAPGDADELPSPVRGKALDELVVIRAIAVERGLHVIFFLLLAVLLIALDYGLPTLQRDALAVIPLLDQTRSGQQLLSDWLTRLVSLKGVHIWILAGTALGYAVLEAVECVFLWKGKRWAEYLTVVATAGFLPLGINALLTKVTPMKVGALLVDLAILAYLVWTKRLFGVRGGLPAHQHALNADVDWDLLHRQAPTTKV